MSEHAVVKVKDETGADVTPKSVEIVIGTTSHAFADVAGQGLSLDLAGLAGGEAKLVLTLPDHPALPFSLKLSGTTAKAVGFDGTSPLCCTLSKQTATDGAAGTRTLFVFAFAMTKKHTEIVLAAGWDYHGGADNTLYAKTWRDDLWAGTTYATGTKTTIGKLITPTTVVTLFDFKSGNRTRYIKGSTDWHRMDKVLQGAVATYTAGGETDAALQKRYADDSISIVHVYGYIQDLGVAAPASLLRFDIFSHAWVGGPIMINTWEGSAYSSTTSRDPSDKDGRSKDFASMARVADFKKAFGAGAVAKMWGCQATTDNRTIVRAAARAKDKAAKMKISYAGKDYDISAAEIANAVRTKILPGTYMKALATAAGITMYGAPPGMGANLRAVGSRNYMYVDQSTYALEYKWYADALGLKPDVTGYFAYEP